MILNIISDYKANVPLHMIANKYKVPIHDIIRIMYSLTMEKKK